MSRVVCSISFAILLLGCGVQVLAWGTWGHNYINKGAILALPKEMGLFFYRHCDFIIEESTVPDLRKYTLNDKAEHPRHYINLESYNYPAKPLPTCVDSANSRWGQEFVNQYGILPWHMEEMMTKLTDAMRKKRKTEVLFLAADLGHYAGDAHVPLHTTTNHNGQLTGQQGIHAFWESQLPELFGDSYNLYAGTATYISDVPGRIASVIDSSFHLLNPLLQAEREVHNNLSPSIYFVLNADGSPVKNKFNQPIRTREYAQRYNVALQGMVEDQIRKAIRLTADLWYTAWVNAGKPDLSSLETSGYSESLLASYEADMAAWKKGRITGCNPEPEFPTIR